MSTATARSGRWARVGSHCAFRYAVSVISSGSDALRLHSHDREGDEFHIERRADDEVEGLYEEPLGSRGLGVMPARPFDQKWPFVTSDVQLRWQEERNRRPVRLPLSKSFLPRGIFANSSTRLSRLSRPGRSVHVREGTPSCGSDSCVELKGTLVLAQSPAHIGKKGSARYDSDNTLEYQVARYIEQMINSSGESNESIIMYKSC